MGISLLALTGMDTMMRAAAIVFLVLGLAFVLFNRQIAQLFRWLDRIIWDKHGSPVGDAPRSVAFVLGVAWIACALVLWFVSRQE